MINQLHEALNCEVLSPIDGKIRRLKTIDGQRVIYEEPNGKVTGPVDRIQVELHFIGGKIIRVHPEHEVKLAARLIVDYLFSSAHGSRV